MSLSLVTAEKPAEKSASLRRELQDAQADASAAEGRARTAREVFEKAEKERIEAEAKLRQRQSELDAIRQAATERAAKGFTDALRAGAPLPLMVAPPIDNAALIAAQGRHDALQMAAAVLAAERDKTAAAAARAANTVEALVHAIQEHDARALAAEIDAAFNHYWKLRDKLSGYVRINETALSDLHDEIAKNLNRQRRLALKDARFYEDHFWRDWLDRIATGSKKQWQEYGQRLTLDAAARFSEESSQ